MQFWIFCLVLLFRMTSILVNPFDSTSDVMMQLRNFKIAKWWCNINLSIYLYLSFSISIYLYLSTFICLPLSIYLYIYLSIYLQYQQSNLAAFLYCAKTPLQWRLRQKWMIPSCFPWKVVIFFGKEHANWSSISRVMIGLS